MVWGAGRLPIRYGEEAHVTRLKGKAGATGAVIIESQFERGFTGDYALRQPRGEPKLTALLTRRIVVRERCQRRLKAGETYAHFSNSKAHEPVRSHPR